MNIFLKFFPNLCTLYLFYLHKRSYISSHETKVKNFLYYKNPWLYYKICYSDQKFTKDS